MSDPYLEKLAELVRRIHRQTNAGLIKWRDVEGTPGQFQSDINKRKITIGLIDYEHDGIPTQDVEIAVYDNVDRKIESVRDSSLTDVYPDIDGFSGWYAIMLFTYEAARRQVNGSEDAINQLLADLDDTMF